MNLQDDEHLKFLIQSAPIGICILNADTHVAEMLNDKFLEIAGKPREAIEGKWYWEAFAEARPYYQEALNEVSKTGKPYYADEVKLMLIRHGRQEWIFVTFVYAPVMNGTGKTTKIAVWVLENTRQVMEREKVAAAREAAEKERDRLYEFFRQAPAGICVLTGSDLHYELVNPNYQELLPGRNLLGRPIFEALPELLGTPIQQILLDVYHNAERFEVREQLIPVSEYEGGPTHDRYFTFTYVPRIDLDNQVDGIFAFVYEVTHILDAKIRIEETNQMLNLAVSAADLGVWSLDLKTNVFQLSERAAKINGLGASVEVEPAKVLALIVPEYRDLVRNAIDKAISGNERFHEEYLIQPVNQESQKWLSATGFVRYNDRGEAVALIGTLLDITEQKLDDLRKNDFIGMVSHELKTPLTLLSAIVQMSGVKLKLSEDDFLASAMRKANQQVKKMSNLINGFLNVSRLESGKILIDKSNFVIGDLIQETIDEVRLTGITQSITLRQCEEATVWADRDKIGSVISNFLSNAVKYSPSETYISVDCQVLEESVQVSVTDQGPGIRAEDATRLFERYYRVQNKGNEHVSGFGIGLYLSAEIVERHHGKIWLSSKMGKGSTFYFSLPLSGGDP